MTHSWKTELPSWILIGAMWIALALGWGSAPDRIPVHWNLAGQVDRWGGRFEGLVLMPILGMVLYFVFRFLPGIDPSRANYAAFRTAYDVIRHGVIALLAILYLLILAMSRGARLDMALAVSSLVGIFFVVVGLLMPRLKQNWFFGFRTPWTLTSAVAWERGNRAAGWTLVLAGLAIAAAGWIRTPASIIAVAAIVLVGMTAAAWVSYRAWRADPNRAKSG
jgi:uncharacterized membrane protein